MSLNFRGNLLHFCVTRDSIAVADMGGMHAISIVLKQSALLGHERENACGLGGGYGYSGGRDSGVDSL
jgi:hypothetical protein